MLCLPFLNIIDAIRHWTEVLCIFNDLLIKGILERKEYILAAVKKTVIQSLFLFAFDPYKDTTAQKSSYYSKLMPIILK